MEDLNKMLELSELYPVQLECMTEEFLSKLRIILWGQAAVATTNKEKRGDELSAAAVVSSPQQTKKRVKRLPSLTEDTETEPNNEHNSRKVPSPRKSKRSNAELLASAEAMESVKAEVEGIELPPVPAPRIQSCINGRDNTEPTGNNEERKSNSSSLMPPPPAPISAVPDETLNRRPQRAAKLKSEKNLKEPKLSTKLRRPTTNDEVKIKLEHEQRASQMHEKKSVCPTALSKQNSAPADENEIVRDSSSSKSDDSVVVVPRKQPSIVSINSTIDSVSTATASSDNQQSSKEQKKSTESDNGLREVRIKIKREKISLPNQTEILPETSIDVVFKAPDALPLPTPAVKSESAAMEDTATNSSTMSSTISTTTTVPTKKGRRKKDIAHRPIKVERFSDLDHKPSPISSRTRHGSMNKSEHIDPLSTTEVKRPASIYEDAVEAPPSSNSKGEVNNATITVTGAINETVNLGPASDATMNLGAAPSDATFCTNPTQTTFQVAPGQSTFIMDANPNATLTINKQSGSVALGDATFDVQQIQKTMNDKDDDANGQRSFETAKDSSVARNDNSLLTEDDSCEQEKLIPTKTKVPSSSSSSKKAVEPSKTLASTKTGYKIPTRTNELFNPLVQSPVKLRVEAFENAAAAATEQSKRPLRSKKENLTSSSTTPVIGKLAGPALGRFLTPTQGSNIGTVNSAIAKKGTTSASKAMTMPKYASASSLHRSNSTASTKTLQRENSADDFRKGLHNLAEERKKQREQKHLLAAQQREIKERERAERMAKLAKEREEKRLLKKQQEQELKKKELEEIQRKLRQQQEEEAAKLKAVKEREMLLHLKQQQQLAKQKMMPPPPKVATKYTFEMLHEDDSTDDEDKVSYKRPPPPTWSRSHARGPIMLKQEYTPAPYIDSFFSVQPMTPDLKIIFPDIDARHLKRNSSVLWSTPPRYSELPKY